MTLNNTKKNAKSCQIYSIVHIIEQSKNYKQQFSRSFPFELEQ